INTPQLRLDASRINAVDVDRARRYFARGIQSLKCRQNVTLVFIDAPLRFRTGAKLRCVNEQFVWPVRHRLKSYFARIDSRRVQCIANLIERRLLFEPDVHQRAASEVNTKIESANLN